MRDDELLRQYKKQEKTRMKKFLHSEMFKFIIIAILIVIVAVVFYFLYYSWSFFSEYSAFLALISSTTLVIVTLAYVIFTHEHVNLLSKQILESEKPSIYTKINFIGNEFFHVTIDIINVSDYAATNINHRGFIVVNVPSPLGMGYIDFDLEPSVYPAIEPRSKELTVTRITSTNEFFDTMDRATAEQIANTFLIYSVVTFQTLSGKTLKTDSVQKFFYEHPNKITPLMIRGFSFNTHEATVEDISYVRNSDHAFEEYTNLVSMRHICNEKMKEELKDSRKLIMMTKATGMRLALFPEYEKVIKSILEEHGFNPSFKRSDDFTGKYTLMVGRIIKHKFIQFDGDSPDKLTMILFLDGAQIRHKIFYPEDIVEHKEEIIKSYEEKTKRLL